MRYFFHVVWVGKSIFRQIPYNRSPWTGLGGVSDTVDSPTNNGSWIVFHSSKAEDRLESISGERHVSISHETYDHELVNGW
jgi:hypothetical protein